MTLSDIKPLIPTGTPKFIFNCGDYSGLVLENLNSLGPMEYPFVLTVNHKEDKETLFVLTVESNSIDTLLLNEIQDREQLQDTTKNYFLSCYDSNEHINYGSINKLDGIEEFMSKGFEILKERLGITCNIHLREIVNNIKEIQELFDRIALLDLQNDNKEILNILNKAEELDTNKTFIEQINKMRGAIQKYVNVRDEANIKYDNSSYQDNKSKNKTDYFSFNGCITFIFLLFAILGLLSVLFKFIS